MGKFKKLSLQRFLFKNKKPLYEWFFMVGGKGYYSQLIHELSSSENIILFKTIHKLLKLVA